MTLFLCKLEGETLIDATDKVEVYQLLGDAMPTGFHIAISEITEYGNSYIEAKRVREAAYEATVSLARAFAEGLATEDELDRALTAYRMAGKNLKHQDYLRDQQRALNTALQSKGIWKD